MKVNETCPCGGGMSATSDSESALARIVNDWRGSHPCPARDRAEREVVSGAQTEQSYAAPHRTDAELLDAAGRLATAGIGFVAQPDPTIPEVRELLGYPVPEQRGPLGRRDTPAVP